MYHSFDYDMTVENKVVRFCPLKCGRIAIKRLRLLISISLRALNALILILVDLIYGATNRQPKVMHRQLSSIGNWSTGLHSEGVVGHIQLALPISEQVAGPKKFMVGISPTGLRNHISRAVSWLARGGG